MANVMVTEGATHAVSEETRARADELKVQGNEALAHFKFTTAVEFYTRAIELAPTAIFYANRAAAHVKSESYGLAIDDASAAIELEPSYIKAYYRRGSAQLALGHHKKAVKDFRLVVRMKPQDRDARAKLKLCEKIIKEAAFAAAIQSERNLPLSETIDVNSLVVDPAYDGPTLPDDMTQIKPDFIVALMDRFKRGKLLHRKFVIQILLKLKEMFSAMPSLLRIGLADDPDAHFTVCGDTHGQFYDVCNIFSLNGLPSESNPYLFNGDFVDRGSFSFEVVMTLFAMKLVYPQHVHLLRGNHESKNMNKIYGFEGEVKHKYDETVMQLFTEVFNWLPLAAVIENRVLVVHGGLFSEENVTLADIEKIDRNHEPPESGLMSDLMWSDPQPFQGRGPSKRGIGLSFGPDVTKAFLEHNKLDLLVRSHEVKDEGYLVEHDGKCITVFSAPNYCDQMGNKGAFIRFEKDMQPRFTQFAAVEHPPIRPMAYAGNMGGMFG
ncbi:Serine/threonine-protein phosphatase 5 [Phytophthora boehmeriae]|uniref:Serine/threonine-protein phosphatase n=1 Tax=Phytophthora boehmeriae TaxID=109152 RepID=A0A8T1VR41_9STRA|nr:Serine/threonine-protein phosphatase 5 [Phytophthora boehmeriae]